MPKGSGGGGNGGRSGGGPTTTHVLKADGEELHVHMEKVITESGNNKTVIETTKPFEYNGQKLSGKIDYSPQGTRIYIGDKTVEGRDNLRRAIIRAKNDIPNPVKPVPGADANLRQWKDSWQKETGKY